MILTPLDSPCISIDDIKNIDKEKTLFDKSLNLYNPQAKRFIDFYNK